LKAFQIDFIVPDYGKSIYYGKIRPTANWIHFRMIVKIFFPLGWPIIRLGGAWPPACSNSQFSNYNTQFDHSNELCNFYSIWNCVSQLLFLLCWPIKLKFYILPLLNNVWPSISLAGIHYTTTFLYLPIIILSINTITLTT
jgi:hypothetical protein